MTKPDDFRWEKGGCLPVPLASIWITGECSLRCKHCYENHSACNRRHLTKKEVLLTLDRMAPFVNSISFMGGEPTLHPDLPEICDYARNRLGKYTLLVSNGVIFPEKLIDQLEGKIDCIKLGMDGITAKCHNAVRGGGSFESTMKTWEKLPSRIPTMCKFTLNAINLVELPLVADFYQNLGAKRLVLNGWLQLGSGAKVWNRQFALSDQRRREINDYIWNELKPRYQQFPVSRSCSLDDGCLEIPPRTYYITNNGAVSPCIFSSSLAIGDIRAPQVNIETLLAGVNRIRTQYNDLHIQDQCVTLVNGSDCTAYLVEMVCQH